MSDSDRRPYSQEEKKDLAKTARELIEDKAFIEAVRRLRKQWFDELMNEPANTLQQAELCSRLRTLERVGSELVVIMNLIRDGRPRPSP